MPSRKRAFEEVDAVQQDASPSPVSPFLDRLRNMWEFANLMQYIYIFGSVVKISNEVDIDLLETECCSPAPSDLLPQIGLALLKVVSSHRGLTPDLFDEYTRRQYDAKAPNRPNPFGADEEPLKFTDFDVFLKIRVLHQLSVWTFWNPDRIRQALSNENERSWYIEPFGWDSQDRTYYSLDDNRLYRMTDPSIPIPSPKKKKAQKPPPKKAKGSRSSKRQKLANGAATSDDADDEADTTPVPLDGESQQAPEQDPGLGLGGAQWECVAITLKDYKDFAESIRKSKDPNEKELYNRMIDEMLPIIEGLAAAQERKAAQRRRELENLQRLATAKRSSRIADKNEKQKEQQETEELERKRQQEIELARKQEEKQRKLEVERESRMMNREQRLKDRETKRILHEEELARLEALSQDGDSAEARISERRRKNEVEKKRRQLEEWKADDEEWYFDCSICGVHGKNWDDGTHSIACDKCGVWQHSSCHGIKEEEAERDEFHFLCSTCLKPPKPIKLTVANQASPKASKKPKEAKKLKDSTKKRKKQDPNQPVANGTPTQETKKRKKTPKTPKTLLERYSPFDLQPYESIMQMNSDAGSSGLGKPPFYPAQGHFAPPTNGHSSTTPSGTNSTPRQSHGNGTQLNNTSNITWQNLSPSHFSRAYQRSPHNPFLNDFGRQRIAAYTQQSPSYSSPRPKLSPSSSNFSTSRAGPPQINERHTSHTQATQLPPIAASPTPSLSATQGNTSVRFSPMDYQTSNTNGAGTVGSSNTNSYMPAVNSSNKSALSPTKQTSSPPLPLPHNSSRGPENAATGSRVPSFQSPPTSTRAGMSPIKQESAQVMPRPPYSQGQGIANVALDVNTPAQAETPTPLTAAGLAKKYSSPHNAAAPLPVPSLAPSVGLSVDTRLPQKTDLPQTQGPSELSHAAETPQASTLPPAPSLSPSVGLNGRAESPEKKEAPSSPPLQASQPQETALAHPTTLPPAPILSPSEGLRVILDAPEKKEVPKSPPVQSLQSPKTASVQPPVLPPAPALAPSVGLSGGVETAEKIQVPHSLEQPNHINETILQPISAEPVISNSLLNANVPENERHSAAKISSASEHRQETTAAQAEAPMPNGVADVDAQPQATFAAPREGETQHT